MDGRADGDAFDLGDRTGHVISKVGLGQQHDGTGAALVGHQQITLDSTRVEVAVEAHDQEHRVDVGSDHLLFGELAGDLAGELGPARQDRLDGRGSVALTRERRHPIADGGQLISAGRLMQQASRVLRLELAARRVKAKDVVELDGDARGDQSRSRVRLKRLRPCVIPSEFAEIEGHSNQDTSSSLFAVRSSPFADRQA